LHHFNIIFFWGKWKALPPPQTVPTGGIRHPRPHSLDALGVSVVRPRLQKFYKLHPADRQTYYTEQTQLTEYICQCNWPIR